MEAGNFLAGEDMPSTGCRIKRSSTLEIISEAFANRIQMFFLLMCYEFVGVIIK